jgi:hypothetical protein
LSTPSRTINVLPPGGRDAARNREFLQLEVERQRACAETGADLIVADAVAIEVTYAADGHLASLQTVTAAAYDEVIAERAAARAADRSYAVTVYDGRLLFGGAA